MRERLYQQQQDEIEHLRQQLTDEEAQNAVLQQQVVAERQQNALLQQLHHEERMRWISSIGSIITKMDILLTEHNSSKRQIQAQIQNLSDRLTIHPNQPKSQGFALVLREHPQEGVKELQFIAGQRKYVRSKLRDTGIFETIVPFTVVPSGVNLRNRFAREASQRIAKTLGPLARRACAVIPSSFGAI